MLLPVMILSAAVLCFSEEKCEVTALKVQKPISIDGILSEPAWEKAHAIEVGRLVSRNKKAPGGYHAELRTLYTDDSLYVSMKCYNPYSPILKTSKRERDGHGYEDESIELFIDPGGGKGYFQFVVSAGGSICDGNSRQGAWDGQWQAVVNIVRSVWIVELRIPFRELGVSPQAGDKWLMNCCRNAHAKGRDPKRALVLSGRGYYDPVVPLIFD